VASEIDETILHLLVVVDECMDPALGGVAYDHHIFNALHAHPYWEHLGENLTGLPRLTRALCFWEGHGLVCAPIERQPWFWKLTERGERRLGLYCAASA
jgi:hypothetical protein